MIVVIVAALHTVLDRFALQAEDGLANWQEACVGCWKVGEHHWRKILYSVI